jgi:hypothetical protein
MRAECDREEGREHLGKLLTITHDPNAAIKAGPGVAGFISHVGHEWVICRRHRGKRPLV